MEELSVEEKVRVWFKEFEEDDKKYAQDLIDKKVNPEFDFQKEYLQRYRLHCPKFRELMKTKSEYSIKTLWEIYDFKIKLTKKGLVKTSTVVSCKNCHGVNGEKACEWR